MGVLLRLKLGKMYQMSLAPICRSDISLAESSDTELKWVKIFGIVCILTLFTKFLTPKVLPKSFAPICCSTKCTKNEVFY